MTAEQELNEAVSINVTKIQARVLRSVMESHVMRLQTTVSGRSEFKRWEDDFAAIIEELRLAAE